MTLRTILTGAHIPEDQGIQLYEQLKCGKLLCGSDGSVINNKAGYAFLLDAPKELNSFWGANICPPACGTASSLRAESFGALAIALAIKLLITLHGPAPLGNFLAVIDNSTVIQIINEESSIMSRKAMLLPEYN